MTFKNYIELDGRRYMTSAQSWAPEASTPANIRLLINGNLDATYGQGSLKVWSGDIMVDNSPPNDGGSPAWGTVDELRASLVKRTGLAFKDHYGTAYTVHVTGYKEASLSPKWDGANNTMYFSVSLIGKA